MTASKTILTVSKMILTTGFYCCLTEKLKGRYRFTGSAFIISLFFIMSNALFSYFSMPEKHNIFSQV